MIRCVSHNSSSRFGVTNPAFISEWICDSKLSCFLSSSEISSGDSGRFGLVEVIGGTYLQTREESFSQQKTLASRSQHTSTGGRFSVFSMIAFAALLVSFPSPCARRATQTALSAVK
jgi:hypothetical protein